VRVRYQDGTEELVHFFASRLKYSRWAGVTVVPHEQVETLVRTLVDHVAAFGGIPLVAVFDRPKTVAANMLFHVVNERHRRHRSMIFTTNKALKAWGRVLHDEDLGQAIIDRVNERGRLLQLDGPSIRTLHLKLDETLKDESDQDDEAARISGISGQNFRNPQC
jgi:hypothetical protein